MLNVDNDDGDDFLDTKIEATHLTTALSFAGMFSLEGEIQIIARKSPQRNMSPDNPDNPDNCKKGLISSPWVRGEQSGGFFRRNSGWSYPGWGGLAAGYEPDDHYNGDDDDHYNDDDEVNDYNDDIDDDDDGDDDDDDDDDDGDDDDNYDIYIYWGYLMVILIVFSFHFPFHSWGERKAKNYSNAMVLPRKLILFDQLLSLISLKTILLENACQMW